MSDSVDTVSDLEKIRAYLAANYPESVEGENHHLTSAGNFLGWGFAEFGEPPSREQMLAWVPGQISIPDPRQCIEDAKKAVREAQPEAEDAMMFLLNLLGDLADEP